MLADTKKILRENGLSIVLFALFFVTQFALTLSGWYQYNHEQRDHGEPPVAYSRYLASPELLETTMENWESEFLQMYLFVVLTTHLYQKGSAASKKIDAYNEVDADPRLHAHLPETPWPVKRGGIALRLYEQSLGSAFLLLFIVSFVLHAIGGARAYSEEQLLHGGEAVSVWQYFLTAQFWFESLQNWQSEFFSIALMVVLTVFLRQRYSPESKPVACPHSQTE